MSPTTMGMKPILNSRTKTYTIFPDGKDHKNEIHLVYISQISLEEDQVRVKPLHITNFESIQNARNIGHGNLIATVEKRSHQIFFGVHNSFDGKLPRRKLELILDDNGTLSSLGAISMCMKYKDNNYSFFRDVYGSFIIDVIEEIKAHRLEKTQGKTP